MDILNFPRVHTGYQDREERSVCAGCGSYYVVSPERLKKSQEILDDLVEALKTLLAKYRLARPQIFGTDNEEEAARQALAKSNL
ncbi:hypothetical protein LCGC14_1437020 [marine sediment metagenome]|uniref:Uncharacterized protein n=1 Tax=marine sediment metagenome TaxID=412755 RepID=A0A0F9MNS7_9ZZZZ